MDVNVTISHFVISSVVGDMLRCLCVFFPFYVDVIINTLLMRHTYEQRCLFMNTNESQ